MDKQLRQLEREHWGSAKHIALLFRSRKLAPIDMKTMAYAGNVSAQQMIGVETHWGKLKNIIKNWDRRKQMKLMAALCEATYKKISKRPPKKGWDAVTEAMGKLREFVAKDYPPGQGITDPNFFRHPFNIEIPHKNHRDWAWLMLYAILQPSTANWGHWEDCIRRCKEELTREEFAKTITRLVLEQ